MRRQFLPLFFAILPAFAACDPDLTPAAKPGAADAAKEVSVGDGPGPVDGDSGGGGDGDAGDVTDGDVDAGEDAPVVVVTHKIDGTNDFKAGEHFVTSSTGNGYEGYIAWDATFIYLGMSGPDVGSGDAKKWVLVYIGGGAGTTTGEKYGNGQGQQPTLAFSAEYHLRWKADGTYTNAEHWSGSAWTDATGLGVVPTAAKSGTFMEMAVKRSAIGNPTSAKIVMTMINETPGSDWTFSSVPSTAITDGVDPDYAKYFDFDLSDTTKSPNQYSALP